MAKRSKNKSRGPKRKYRVYARKVGSVSVKEVGLTVVGAIAGRFVTNALGKLLPVVVKSNTSKAATQIALGFITKPLAQTLGVKSPNVDALAKGMMIGGGYELVRTVAPAMLGAADDSDGDVIVVSGNDEISEMNGMDEIGQDISEINGMDEIGAYGYEY
jgi:hypothetical protein